MRHNDAITPVSVVSECQTLIAWGDLKLTFCHTSKVRTLELEWILVSCPTGPQRVASVQRGSAH